MHKSVSMRLGAFWQTQTNTRNTEGKKICMCHIFMLCDFMRYFLFMLACICVRQTMPFYWVYQDTFNLALRSLRIFLGCQLITVEFSFLHLNLIWVANEIECLAESILPFCKFSERHYLNSVRRASRLSLLHWSSDGRCKIWDYKSQLCKEVNAKQTDI